MDPHAACALVLVLCLGLILMTYVLGVEVGKARAERARPGGPPRAAPASGRG